MSDQEEETAAEPDDELDVPAADVDESDGSQANDRGSDHAGEPDESTGVGVSGHDVRAYVEWGAFAICALFAVIAALQLYLSVDRLVSIWIAAEFQPAFRAAFNLAVLLLAGYGAFTLAERLNE